MMTLHLIVHPVNNTYNNKFKARVSILILSKT
jgi:hypothetical protein